jgi:thioredoxin 2
MTDPLHIVCPHCHTTNRVRQADLTQAPDCGGCHKPLFVAHSLALTEPLFDRHVSRSQIPLLVDFWAPWCGPCRMMAPAFEKVSKDLHGQARFVKVNTEVEQSLAAAYNIRSIPTLAIFANGREMIRQAGAMSATDLARWVSAALPRV